MCWRPLCIITLAWKGLLDTCRHLCCPFLLGMETQKRVNLKTWNKPDENRENASLCKCPHMPKCNLDISGLVKSSAKKPTYRIFKNLMFLPLITLDSLGHVRTTIYLGCNFTDRLQTLWLQSKPYSIAGEGGYHEWVCAFLASSVDPLTWKIVFKLVGGPQTAALGNTKHSMRPGRIRILFSLLRGVERVCAVLFPVFSACITSTNLPV